MHGVGHKQPPGDDVERHVQPLLEAQVVRRGQARGGRRVAAEADRKAGIGQQAQDRRGHGQLGSGERAPDGEQRGRQGRRGERQRLGEELCGSATHEPAPGMAQRGGLGTTGCQESGDQNQQAGARAGEPPHGRLSSATREWDTGG